MRHGSLYTKLIQSREWKTLRAQVLSEQPLCQWCKAKGYVVAAREVHHLVEVESGRTEADVRRLMFARTQGATLPFDGEGEGATATEAGGMDRSDEVEIQRRITCRKKNPGLCFNFGGRLESEIHSPSLLFTQYFSGGVVFI